MNFDHFHLLPLAHPSFLHTQHCVLSLFTDQVQSVLFIHSRMCSLPPEHGGPISSNTLNFYLCLLVFSCTYVYCVCALYPRRAEEGLGSPETRVSDGSEPPCCCWEPNLCYSTLTTEASLHD